MRKFNKTLLEDAHRASSMHESALKKSRYCGCFYCKSVFETSQIEEWTDENKEERTALCPYCDIDAVIPEVFPIREEDFLKALYTYAFQTLEDYFNENDSSNEK